MRSESELRRRGHLCVILLRLKHLRPAELISVQWILRHVGYVPVVSPVYRKLRAASLVDGDGRPWSALFDEALEKAIRIRAKEQRK